MLSRKPEDLPEPPGVFRVDLSYWPVVVLSANSKRMSDDEVKAHLDWFTENILKHGQPFAFVSDNRGTTAMPPRQRRMLAAYIRDQKELLDQHQRAVALVIDSSLLRGLITAIHWLAKPACPTQSFAGLAEAVRWSQETLRASGVTLADSPGDQKAI